MRRREPPAPVGAGGLPAKIAAGPKRWPSLRDWMTAGREWSESNDLGHRGWIKLLDPDVAYWTTSLGSAHWRDEHGA